MALAQHNITLEYAANTVSFWYYGDNGEELAFAADTVFNISRIDDESNNYSASGSIDGNKITFIINPPASLQAEGDTLYDYDHKNYEHVYSVKSVSTSQVYLVGKLNLIKVA